MDCSAGRTTEVRPEIVSPTVEYRPTIAEDRTPLLAECFLHNPSPDEFPDIIFPVPISAIGVNVQKNLADLCG